MIIIGLMFAACAFLDMVMLIKVRTFSSLQFAILLSHKFGFLKMIYMIRQYMYCFLHGFKNK